MDSIGVMGGTVLLSVLPLSSIHNRADCPDWLRSGIEAIFEPISILLGENQ
jgi:hypothetical protein